MHGQDQQDKPKRTSPNEADEARWFSERAIDNYDRIAQAVHAGRLVACKDCGRLVSRRALACPSCGALNGAKAVRIALYLAGVVALALLVSTPGQG